MTQKIGANRKPGLKPFKKGEGGRPRGVPNKLTRTAKENINAVYEKLGGIAGHVEFLRSHKFALADFYGNVYPKLIPTDVNLGNQGGGKENALRLEVVHTKGAELDGGNGNGNGKGKAGA